ncbi:hypothetical protein [Jiangella asiatica]|uniref:Uncharacterized protein n=1 Tax=Jiangella asiatica TaxID=2530372 RepID=A0A4R5CT99_9ACTN|nr:hypothetical protein [Jiangella asiatica]TDE02827.1 hypothetical protein E1269_21285 [Jiangella asiatica]
MAVNDQGIWTPDDTELFGPPGSGLDTWLKRMGDSITRPEGTITQPWRVHYKTTSQTIPDNTFTDISGAGWTGGTGDPGSTVSGITHSSAGYTVSQDGWYRVELDVAFLNNSIGGRQAQIRINGNIERTITVAAVSGSATTALCDTELSLSAGDVVSFWTRQTSGGDLGMPEGSDAGRKFIRRVALL